MELTELDEILAMPRRVDSCSGLSNQFHSQVQLHPSGLLPTTDWAVSAAFADAGGAMAIQNAMDQPPSVRYAGNRPSPSDSDGASDRKERNVTTAREW